MWYIYIYMYICGCNLAPNFRFTQTHTSNKLTGHPRSIPGIFCLPTITARMCRDVALISNISFANCTLSAHFCGKSHYFTWCGYGVYCSWLRC